MARLRQILTAGLMIAMAGLQACGGGGGSSTTSTTSSASTSNSSNSTTAPAVSVPSGNAIAAAASNVHPIIVNAGLGGNVNLPFASVTLCAPGSSTSCQTINNIVVDTGSSGLRILSSALSPSLALTQQVDAKGNPLVQCTHFVDGYTWGPVKLADLKIAGEQASSLPIQVIGDPGFASIPVRCAASGPSKNSVTALRANGILGVSSFRQDCGTGCTVANNRGIYYSCVGAVCAQTAVPLSQQVQNPVALFAVNNNGVILQLPGVSAAGATSVSGSMVFGIGTQANNGLGAAIVVGIDPTSGNFATVYNGSSLSASFIDSGSNGLFFPSSLPVCSSTSAAPGFYCPVSVANESATIVGTNGARVNVAFSIANADALLLANPGFAAFPNLGAYFSAGSFDWGLPFFYGRSVYTAIEGANTPVGAGPYVAF